MGVIWESMCSIFLITKLIFQVLGRFDSSLCYHVVEPRGDGFASWVIF